MGRGMKRCGEMGRGVERWEEVWRDGERCGEVGRGVERWGEVGGGRGEVWCILSCVGSASVVDIAIGEGGVSSFVVTRIKDHLHKHPYIWRWGYVKVPAGNFNILEV